MEKQQNDRAILRVLMKHKAITVGCLLVAVAIAAAYIHITPTKYVSELSLQSKIPSQQLNISLLNNDGKSTSTELLTSPDYLTNAFTTKDAWVAYYVERDYQITPANYESPYTAHCEIINKSFYEQQYEVVIKSATDYSLISGNYGQNRIQDGKIGQPIIVNGVKITLALKELLPYSVAPKITDKKFYLAIYSPKAVADNLANNNVLAVENNGVINLSCTHRSPEIALKAVNILANYYLNPVKSSEGNTGTTQPGLEERISTLAQELQEKETLIASYKSANQITEISIDAQKSMNVLEELQLQKSQLELQMAALDNISNYLRKNRSGNNSLVEYGAINDPVFNEQINSLNQKYQALSDPNSTDPSIEALKNQIAERLLNTRKRIAIQIEATDKQLASTRSQLALIPGKAQSLEALERGLLLDKKVYDLLIERKAQSIVDGSTPAMAASILKPSNPQPQPVNTPTAYIYLLASLLGLITSYILGRLADHIHAIRIHSREELDQLTNIPFIGNIVLDQKNPLPLKESFNNLCTKILMKPDVKVVTITSTNSGEGKTFIASHLAQAYSAIDKKVLLIDLNTQNPEIAELYNIRPVRTIIDVLNGTCDVHDAVCLTSYPNLNILMGGEMTDGVNQLLASSKRDKLIAELKKHYDLIIIDTAESLNNIDSVPLMKLSDMTLYVAKAKSTRRESLVNAELIRKDYQIENMYFILNSITKPDTHTGKTGRGTYRKIHSSGNQKVKVDYVPAVLRKIALWFY
jgi:capsular exopolysaccharide synthesis family protein